MVNELWLSDVSLCQHFFWTLICNSSVRKYQITIWFFDNFWSASNALSVCVSWFLAEFLQFLPNLNHIISHGLNPLGLKFNANISKATSSWHVKHWFSRCRCNVASFKYKKTFSQGGAIDLQKKVFGSRTIFIIPILKNWLEHFAQVVYVTADLLRMSNRY